MRRCCVLALASSYAPRPRECASGARAFLQHTPQLLHCCVFHQRERRRLLSRSSSILVADCSASRSTLSADLRLARSRAHGSYLAASSASAYSMVAMLSAFGKPFFSTILLGILHLDVRESDMSAAACCCLFPAVWESAAGVRRHGAPRAPWSAWVCALISGHNVHASAIAGPT